MFESIFEWLVSTCGELIENIINWFMGALGSIGIGGIAAMFPFLTKAYYVFRAVGMGLVFVVMILSLLKYFTSPVSEVKSTPIEILFRGVLGAAAVWMGGWVAMWIFDIGKLPYDALLNMNANDTQLAMTAMTDAIWEASSWAPC